MKWGLVRGHTSNTTELGFKHQALGSGPGSMGSWLCDLDLLPGASLRYRGYKS